MVPFTSSPLCFFSTLSTLTATTYAFSGFHNGGIVARSTVCQDIADAVSPSSAVYYNASAQYLRDNYHWASSSSQLSQCSFEPATVQDVGIALQILGKSRAPFGIKSGGHATNAGFSSTSGVQIAMYAFSDIVYDADAQTVTVGLGLIWDDIYDALEKYAVTVVGPKVTGIGVGGVVLGGGYSYLTNQYGLSIDNVVSYELVLPNGTVTDITSSSNADLFFALRGGFNNFGIVTTVTLKTYPQGLVWGGRISYSQDQWEAVHSAITNFWSDVSDPKATLYSTYNYLSGVAVASTLLFYDAPNCPEGMFDEFLAISHVDQDISTRSYSSLIQSLPLNALSGLRSVFHSVAMEEITLPVMQMVANETMGLGKELTNSSARIISYGVDPYLTNLYNHTDTPSAYPPSRSKGYSFIELYYGWSDPSDDDTLIEAVYASANDMIEALAEQGQDVGNVAVYPNNGPPGMSLEAMYGDNVARLRAIKNAVDPDNVMGLTGGWKF